MCIHLRVLRVDIFYDDQGARVEMLERDDKAYDLLNVWFFFFEREREN